MSFPSPQTMLLSRVLSVKQGKTVSSQNMKNFLSQKCVQKKNSPGPVRSVPGFNEGLIRWYFALYHVDVSNSKVATGKFHMKFVVFVHACVLS